MRNNKDVLVENYNELIKPKELLKENPNLLATFENEDLRQLQNKIDEPKQIEIDENGKSKALTFMDRRPKYILGIDNVDELEGLISKSTYNNNMLRQSTSKLLWVLISQLTTLVDKDKPIESQYLDANPILRISIKDLAEMEGKSTTKDGLRDLRERTTIDLRFLNSIFFTKKKGNKGDFADLGLGANNLGIERGVAYFEMRKEFANRVILEPTPYLAYLPKEMLRTNDKYNPYSFSLGLAIFLHKRRNLGRKHENIISVKNLYENCKLIPRYEDVKQNKDRHFDRFIIKPFERDLDALSEIFTWEYITPKKDTKANIDYNNFDEWLKLNIKITWLKDLGTETLLKGRADAKRIKENAKNKELKKIGKAIAQKKSKKFEQKK